MGVWICDKVKMVDLNMTAGWAVLTGQLGVFTGRARRKLPTGEPTNLTHDYASSSVQALQKGKSNGRLGRGHTFKNTVCFF